MTEPRKLKAVLLAVFMVLSVFAFATAGGLAAVTIDTETSATTQTSDLTDGGQVTDLDNGSATSILAVSSDSAQASSLSDPATAFELDVTVNDSDSDHDGRLIYENDADWNSSNVTTGGHYYEVNLTHDEVFEDLERDAGETVTLDFNVTFNQSETDQESINIQVDAVNNNTVAVQYVGDSDVNDSDDFETRTVERLGRDDYDVGEVDFEIGTTSDTETVRIVFANDSIRDEYEAAYDARSFDDGDYVPTMILSAEGQPIMIFDSEEGDEFDSWIARGYDADEHAYGVYQSDGGVAGSDDQLEIRDVDEEFDTTSLEVESTGNRRLGFLSNLNTFGFDAARASGVGKAVTGS